MDRYFTIMIVPERQKGVRSYRIPRFMFHAFSFILVTFTLLLIIFGYDYWKIVKQVYENKHLNIENRQLKEQVQLFQMKINALTEDIERVHTFEKKIRIITGLEQVDLKGDYQNLPIEKTERDEDIPPIPPTEQQKETPLTPDSAHFKPLKLKDEEIVEQEEYIKLKDLYEQKIASSFGLQESYTFTKEWTDLTQESFKLAEEYAKFDFMFEQTSEYIAQLEIRIQELDQYLLDKESFLKSTPTLMPSRGWITSYYGLRKNPVSGLFKMHEGLDIGATIGTPVFAPADGVITYSGVKPGYGYLVQIDHGYGVETVFAHNKTSLVKKGQVIRRGDIVAQTGNTGSSTGPHLHYEIRVNGTPVDPLYFILN